MVTAPYGPLLIETAGIRADMRVLDVGSGPGHISAQLAETGAQVTGVDIAPQMVSAAQEHFPEVEFHEANAESLPFDDRTFDAVTCCYTVHHFARPELAFREFLRALKPGGRFVFVHTLAMEFAGPVFTAIDTHHTLDDLTHGPLFGAEDPNLFRSVIDSAGFGKCSLEERVVPYRTASYDALMEGFRIFMSLPDDTWDKIRGASLENVEAYRDGDEFVFNNRVLLGVATAP